MLYLLLFLLVLGVLFLSDAGRFLIALAIFVGFWGSILLITTFGVAIIFSHH